MKNKIFLKRLAAYFIDIMVVSLIFSLLTIFIKDSSNVTNLNNDLATLSENYLNEVITDTEYMNQYAYLTHALDKELFLQNLLNLVLMIGYFVILPYYYNGQTIGKKLLKIKLQKEDGTLTINDLIIRGVIIYGIATTLIGLSLVYLASDIMYFGSISILSFIQFLLVIISAFMILYRKDKKGLQDLVCKTLVVEEK